MGSSQPGKGKGCAGSKVRVGRPQPRAADGHVQLRRDPSEGVFQAQAVGQGKTEEWIEGIGIE